MKTEDSQPELIFVSDAEEGLRKGAKMIFDKSKMFFCTKHLLDNVKDYLKDTDPKVRNEIKTQLFGHNGWGEGGLTDAKDEDDFLRKKIAIDVTAFPPGKLEYVTKKIWHNVKTRLECKGAVEANITSNPVEGVNGKTKLYANFQIQKLPDFIDLLANMAQAAKTEFIQAFTGKGDILLTGHLGHQFTFRPDVWEFKTLSKRDDIFTSFAKGGRRIQNQNETVTTTKGHYTMDSVGGVRQKPNHRKRPTRQRTLTITPSKGHKKRRQDEDDDE